jgi:excisionase family DNA binding protein
MTPEEKELFIGAFTEAVKELAELKAILASYINEQGSTPKKTSTPLTIKQVAAMLGLHYNKVYDLVMTNQIKSYRTSKKRGAGYRITPESIELFRSKNK